MRCGRARPGARLRGPRRRGRRWARARCSTRAGALLALGNGLTQPTTSAFISRRAPADRQGGTLGTNQSFASLARTVRPGDAAAGSTRASARALRTPRRPGRAWWSRSSLAAMRPAQARPRLRRFSRSRPRGSANVAPCPAFSDRASSRATSPSSPAAGAASASPSRGRSASSARRSPSAGATRTSSRPRKAELAARGGDASHAGDVRHPRASSRSRRSSTASARRWARSRVLVNNAGGQFPTPAEHARAQGLGRGHPQQPERHVLHDARGRRRRR